MQREAIRDKTQVQPKKQEIPCPLCNSFKFKLKYSATVAIEDPSSLYGAASGVRGTQTLVVCEECGLLYENPRFAEEVILQGYCSVSQSDHDSQHTMRRKSFYLALCSLRRSIPDPGAKILDIGAAGGAFLDAAQDFGYEAHGIEPSRYLVEQGKARGLRLVQGTLDRHPFKPHSFDMVTLWDVLEHVVDPKAMLQQIRTLLKPDGVLLINYPDIGTWQARLAGRRFWWILSVHLTHFSPKTIRRIAELTDYRVLRFKPYWQRLEFGYLEKMAVHLKVPGAKFLEKITPGFFQKLPFPYYASQTTAILKPNGTQAR